MADSKSAGKPSLYHWDHNDRTKRKENATTNVLDKASFLRLCGGSSIIPLRSPLSLRSTGLSQTDSCIVGLKKKTLSSPVHTTHLGNKRDKEDKQQQLIKSTFSNRWGSEKVNVFLWMDSEGDLLLFFEIMTSVLQCHSKRHYTFTHWHWDAAWPPEYSQSHSLCPRDNSIQWLSFLPHKMNRDI